MPAPEIDAQARAQMRSTLLDMYTGVERIVEIAIGSGLPRDVQALMLTHALAAHLVAAYGGAAAKVAAVKYALDSAISDYSNLGQQKGDTHAAHS